MDASSTFVLYINTPKFPLGRTFITANASHRLKSDEVQAALKRHKCGDWGSELDEWDREENERSLEEGLRLLSKYQSKDGTKFWIITEADRSTTTVLLPEDY